MQASEDRLNKLLAAKPAAKKPPAIPEPSLAEQRVAKMMSPQKQKKQNASEKAEEKAAASAAAALAASAHQDRITAAAKRYQEGCSRPSTPKSTDSKPVGKQYESSSKLNTTPASTPEPSPKHTSSRQESKAAARPPPPSAARAASSAAASSGSSSKRGPIAQLLPPAQSPHRTASVASSRQPTNMAATLGCDVDMTYYEPIIPEDVSPTTGLPQLSVWDRMYGTPPDQILPDFMWLSGERGSLMMDQLPFAGFSHCLFSTNKRTSPYMAKNYLCVQLSDEPGTDLRTWFEKSNEFLENARNRPDSKVLVHCRMGQSRSCTLVAAYIMSHYKCSLKEALLWIKKHRDAVCPNTGFFVQLQKYEKELFGFNVPSISRTEAREAGVCSVSKFGSERQ